MSAPFWEPPTEDELRDYELIAVDAGALMIKGTRGRIMADEAIPRLVWEIRRLRRLASNPGSDEAGER